MPRLRKARSSSLLLLSSSSGTRCGSASTIVTSAPKERQTEANSQPMAPAPRITTEPGMCSMPSASSLSMTRSWSISRPGSERGPTRWPAARARPRCAGRRPRRRWGDQLAGALDDLDLAALHQAGQALVQALDDLALVGVDLRHVDVVERAVDAELLGLLDDVDRLGRVQQGLGRDAAAVQAGAADLVLLHHDDALAELGVAQRGRVAAAAPSEDDEVDGLGLGHGGDSSIDGLCGRAGGSAGTR
jgi:hypothetical protein